MHDKLEQHEAGEREKERERLRALSEKPPKEFEANFDEEDDPDFKDDEGEKEVMRRMLEQRLREVGQQPRGKDERDTNGIGLVV